MALVAQGTKKDEEFFLLSCSKPFFLANVSSIITVIICMLSQRLQFFPNLDWWLAKRIIEAN